MPNRGIMLLLCLRAIIRRLLGQYEIGRLLGEGSFGLVYEARPAGSERRVALKQINKVGVRREEILQGKRTPPVLSNQPPGPARTIGG